MTALARTLDTPHAAEVATTELDRRWLPLHNKRPQLAATAQRYLEQISISLSPSSVRVADQTLRGLCTFLADEHPHVSTFTQVGRPEIEDYKKHLVGRPGQKLDTSATANTVRQRLGTVRTFFDRIIEWDWPDAPARTPIFSIDLPIIDDPLPKFLDDAQAAALLRVASADPDPLHRLVIHLLLRTGMRVGELSRLEANAVVTMRDGHWLRIPLGKLHNDRYIPLHPLLVELLTDWKVRHDDHGTGLLLTRNGRPLALNMIARIVTNTATTAGIGHVHPHQLRHTFATQAVNRGMRIEAIGQMLGHKTLRMTLIYGSRTAPSLMSTALSATRSMPFMTNPTCSAAPPTQPRPSKCAGSASSTDGCSATAGAQGPPSSTAPSRPSAKAAGSSRPPLRSDRPCKPSTTTPSARAKTAAPNCSRIS
jgi:site-specific recombinase XerD